MNSSILMEGVDEKDYKRAQKRVADIKKFYSDLIGYVVIITILFIIDLFTTPGEWWFYWVALIWGILVILHAVKVFAFRSLDSKKWEEDKIKEILDKEKQ
ncbi:MAG: 2TM domain-containing protein [Actinobacteria bacterium]|nr:2TM domain-containing protein [Actinomycetota bacterium]